MSLPSGRPPWGFWKNRGFKIASKSLMRLAYGADTFDGYRRAASYVDQILKGANPANLPVQAPTKFVLVINLTTAKALGCSTAQTR